MTPNNPSSPEILFVRCLVIEIIKSINTSVKRTEQQIRSHEPHSCQGSLKLRVDWRRPTPPEGGSACTSGGPALDQLCDAFREPG